MKYAIILPDGAADEPLDELDGRTVLDAAHTPNMDWIAANGRQGVIVTVPDAFLPGSDVATLSVLGCDPRVFYTGRAPLEAVARDIPVGPRDVVFRCNLVTQSDGRMSDFTAGHITQPEANRLIADLKQAFADEPVALYEGVQYRHFLVFKDVGELTCACTPPHDIPDEVVANHLPKGPGSERIIAIMNKAAGVLADHDVNRVRADLEENPANHIWLWGQGRVGEFQTLHARYGIRCACVAAVDLIRGITKLLGFQDISVEGATGYLDTNYAGKGAAAVEALDTHDLVLVHIEAPDEAGHLGDVEEKRAAIERVDQHVVGPVLEKLKSFDAWKMLVVPDHPTPVKKRTHTRTPPPFCLAGNGIHPVLGRPFSEANANQSNWRIDPGHELLEYFLRG